MGSRFSGRVTIPPPAEMMRPDCLAISARARCSRTRKPSSPSLAKISGMEQPASATIFSSTSARGRPSFWARAWPMVVLPQPGMPMSRMLWVSRSSRRMIWATRLSGSSLPWKRSEATLAWATSMPRPLAQMSPRR